MNTQVDVTHRVPPRAIEADKVFVGLSSPTAPVSNYTYTGFALLSDAFESGRLGGVFVDQPSPGSIRSGAKTALDDYSRLSADFYSKRPDYDRYCGNKKFRDKVHAGISLYLNEPLPLLAPMYPWGRLDALAKRLPQGHQIIPVDPTGSYLDMIELLTLSMVDAEPRGKLWLMETAYAKPPVLRHDALQHPLITVKSPADSQDFSAYSAGLAVLEGDTPIRGWWTPTAAAALTMGTAFVGGKHTGHEFAAPYLDVIGSLRVEEHTDLVRRQLQNLRSKTWTLKALSDSILTTHHDSTPSSVRVAT
jgi:hypothetical protein